MKTKKLFVSLFASVFAVSSLVTLASCNGEKDPAIDDPSADVENPDLEAVQTAINALNVQATAAADFNLTVSAVGGVSISWASSNTDVITISSNQAIVTRPLGGEAVVVKLTATAVLGKETITKEFNVTVTPLEDNSSTVAEIKALEDGKVVEATGVVSEFVYGTNSTTKELEKKGFYLTDKTGTVYVFDTTKAETLAIGDEVYLSATTQKYSSQSRYTGAIQLKSVSSVTKLSSGKAVDYTAVVKGKTIAEISTATDEDGKRSASIPGTVFELTGIVSYQDQGYALCLRDLDDSTKSVNIYYSALIESPEDLEALENYAPSIKDKIGQIVKVRYVVNSMSGDPFEWRGTVLSALPQSEITAEDQAKGIQSAIKSKVQLSNTYIEQKEIDLPTAMTGFDKCTVAWSLKGGSAGAAIADGKLTITPTAAVQKFTLVATVTVEGVTDPIVIEYDEASVCTSFESLTHAEYVAAEANSFVIVEGTIIYGYAGGSNPYFYILDNSGNGYHINVKDLGITEADLAEGGKYAKGTVVKVYGTKTMFNTFPTVASIVSIETLTTPANTTPSDILVDIEADKLGDRYGTYFLLEQVYYDGSNLITSTGKKITYYDQFQKKIVLEAGKVYEFYGIVIQHTGTGAVQVAALEAKEITAKAEPEFIQMCLDYLIAVSYADNTEIEVPTTLYSNTISYSVNPESTTVTYDAGKITIKASENQTSTVSYYLDGNETAAGTLTIVVNKDSRVETMSHSETTTGNMDGTNQATKFGLAAGLLSVVSNKGDQGNHVGVNKDGTFRLYAGSNSSKNGAELIISIAPGYDGTIESIEITLGGTVSAYSINGNEETDLVQNGVKAYAINSEQVIIKNVASTKQQVHIKSIEIKYSATPSETAVLTLNTGAGVLKEGVKTEYTFNKTDENKTVTLPTAADFKSTPYLSKAAFLGWTINEVDLITSVDVIETMEVKAVYETISDLEVANVAEALAICKETGTTATSIDIILEATIKSIDSAYSEQYKNITITLEDSTGTISCFRLAGGSDLVVGAVIKVTGKVVNFNNNTPQFAANATYIIVTATSEAQ